MEKKNKGIEIVNYDAEEDKIIKVVRRDYDIALCGYHTAVRDVKKKGDLFWEDIKKMFPEIKDFDLLTIDPKERIIIARNSGDDEEEEG